MVIMINHLTLIWIRSHYVYQPHESSSKYKSFFLPQVELQIIWIVTSKTISEVEGFESNNVLFN